MTESFVFDTEAIVAYLYDEPGVDAVAPLPDDVFDGSTDGYLTETNASEVFYLVSRFEGTAEDRPTTESRRLADRDLRALERQGLAIERADWRLVAEIEGPDRFRRPTHTPSHWRRTATRRSLQAATTTSTTSRSTSTSTGSEDAAFERSAMAVVAHPRKDRTSATSIRPIPTERVAQTAPPSAIVPSSDGSPAT